MVKRKVKVDTSSESGADDAGNSNSNNEQSDTGLSDHPAPPVTPRKSKRINHAKTSGVSQSKPKKQASSNASFSPSPETKSPKKRRQLAIPKPTTPISKAFSIKKTVLSSPIVLIQTKGKISSKRSDKKASDNESDNEADTEGGDEEDADEDADEHQTENEDANEEDEDEDEDEDDEVEEEDTSYDEDNKEFLDQEAEEGEPSSEEGDSAYEQQRKKMAKSKTKCGQNNAKKSTFKDTEVYLEDLTKDPIIKRPNLRSCKVFDKDLVDIFLAKTYKNLPKLPSGYTNNRYLPKGEEQEPMMYVSELLPGLTKISKKYLLDLFTFVSDKGTSTVNLSRIEPCDLIAKKPDTGSIYPLVFLRHQKTPALCLSIISVDEDYTRHPKDINGSSYKILTGVIQTMEYERLVATLCLVYKVPGIKTLMTNNRWSFSSRPGSSNNNIQTTYKRSSSSYRSTGSKKLSPANSHQGQSQGSKWKIGYTIDENIPILDGRSIQIELPKGLRKVVDTLPAFTEDIPPGSLTLVGYTALGYNAKKSPDELTIGTNICWAVVLATPKA